MPEKDPFARSPFKQKSEGRQRAAGSGRAPEERPGRETPSAGRRERPRPPFGESRAEQARARQKYDGQKRGGGEGAEPERSGQRREESGQEEDGVLLHGVNPVLEILRSDPSRVDSVFIRKGRRDKRSEEILDLCRAAEVRFSLVDNSLLEKLAGRHASGSSQGVLARLYPAGFMEFGALLDGVMDNPMPLILALDQVQDPGNAGTLARTLYALGGAGLVVPRHNGVYLGGAAVKASAGALARLPVAKAANLSQALDEAEERGFTVYGAAMQTEGTESVFDFTPRLPAVLALGGEEGGLRPGIAKRCAKLLHIPMLREFDSLNVAQAGAIILGEFARNLKKNG